MKRFWHPFAILLVSMTPLPGWCDTYVSPQYGDSSSGIGNIIQSASCSSTTGPSNCPSTDPAGLGQLRGAAIAAGETAAQLNSFFDTIAALDRKTPILVPGSNENAALAKFNSGPPALINAPSPPSLDRELGEAVSLARRAVDGGVSLGSGAPGNTGSTSFRGATVPPTSSTPGSVTFQAALPSVKTEGPGWSEGGELYASAGVGVPSTRSLLGSSAPDRNSERNSERNLAGSISEISATEDPADYFSRTPIEDSIFVIVHSRYTKKAESWAKTGSP